MDIQIDISFKLDYPWFIHDNVLYYSPFPSDLKTYLHLRLLGKVPYEPRDKFLYADIFSEVCRQHKEEGGICVAEVDGMGVVVLRLENKVNLIIE